MSKVNWRSTIPPFAAPILALAAAFCCAVTSGHATEFDFSYSFGDGVTWSGTFDGTASGNLVTNVSNVTLLENGVSVGSPIYAGSFNGGYHLGGTVFSFDGLQNNIALFNQDYFSSDTFTAYLIGGTPFGNSLYFYEEVSGGGLVSGGYGEQIDSSHWSLEAASSGVPDGGATVALLGAGLIGLVALRRKFARA